MHAPTPRFHNQETNPIRISQLEVTRFFNYYVSMILSAVITEAEEGGFVALNLETGTTTQGESLAEAVENLKEATALFLEEFPLQFSAPAVMTSFELSHA